MMDAKEIAKLLNGNEYTKEISPELEKVCADNRLVVVFGASDDLMEFRGAIYDELGAWEGTTAYLTSQGLVTNDCNNERCPNFKKSLKQTSQIEAVWGNEGCSWVYKTTIPHEVFDIIEDGETYCRGIVFSLDDVSKSKAVLEGVR